MRHTWRLSRRASNPKEWCTALRVFDHSLTLADNAPHLQSRGVAAVHQSDMQLPHDLHLPWQQGVAGGCWSPHHARGGGGSVVVCVQGEVRPTAIVPWVAEPVRVFVICPAYLSFAQRICHFC